MGRPHCGHHHPFCLSSSEFHHPAIDGRCGNSDDASHLETIIDILHGHAKSFIDPVAKIPQGYCIMVLYCSKIYYYKLYMEIIR